MSPPRRLALSPQTESTSAPPGRDDEVPLTPAGLYEEHQDETPVKVPPAAHGAPAPQSRSPRLVAIVAVLTVAVVGLAAAVAYTQLSKRCSDAADIALPETFAVELPIVIQTRDYTCGVTALASVLNGFGFPGTEMSLAAECGSNEANGTSFAALTKAAVMRGFDVHVRNGWTLAELKAHVMTTRAPVIVDYQAWIDQPPQCSWRYANCSWSLDQWSADYLDGHYSVFIGWNSTGILLMDPSQDPGLYGFITTDQFLARWHDEDTGPDDLTSRLGLGISSPAGKQLVVMEWPQNVGYTW